MDPARVPQILGGAPITSDEAVEILAEVAAKHQGTLADHQLLQAAITHVASALDSGVESG